MFKTKFKLVRIDHEYYKPYFVIYSRKWYQFRYNATRYYFTNEVSGYFKVSTLNARGF